MSSATLIPVVVAGALGRMGAEVIRAVAAAPDCTLVGAIDNTLKGRRGPMSASNWVLGSWRWRSAPTSKAASAP